MNAREKIEAALAKARADREKASEDRAKAGANWRKQDDASATYGHFYKSCLKPAIRL